MRKLDKVIITSATTGAGHMPWMSPYLPLTVEQIVEDSVAAAEAGASIIHLHARDPETGEPATDPKLYEQYLQRIKQRTDAILNLTTGQPQRNVTPEQALENRLAAPLAFAPEITSFNMGPMTFATWTLEQRARESGAQLREWEWAHLELSKSLVMSNSYVYMAVARSAARPTQWARIAASVSSSNASTPGTSTRSRSCRSRAG